MTAQLTNQAFGTLLSGQKPVLPVIRIDEPDSALPLAEALADGGVRLLEITLRTAHGLRAIEQIAKQLPDVVVGVGTISNYQDVVDAANAGARFAVSPGVPHDLETAAYHSLRVPLVPGVFTPSEVMQVAAAGLRYCKLFPASHTGGVSYLKALQGPFAETRFCPTGGVNGNNYKEYLELDNVCCVGGTWLCPQDLIAAKQWDRISELARSVLL